MYLKMVVKWAIGLNQYDEVTAETFDICMVRMQLII